MSSNFPAFDFNSDSSQYNSVLVVEVKCSCGVLGVLGSVWRLLWLFVLSSFGWGGVCGWVSMVATGHFMLVRVVSWEVRWGGGLCV